MYEDFLVMEWAWIEDAFNDEEIELFYDLLNKASEDKAEEKYLVYNEDSLSANKIKEALNRELPAIKRNELLEALEELKNLDSEVAHVEADELLLKYINDKEIEKAFDNIKKEY